MKEETLIPTAERSLRLVELLLERPQGWSPQELLVELDLSRSALFALLHTFKALGYLEQPGKRGPYVAGPRLLAWRSTRPPADDDLLASFYQECQHFYPQQPETLALVIPTGASQQDGFVVLAQVESSAQVRSAFVPQQTYPHLPAAEQVLATAPPPDVLVNGFSLFIEPEALHLALPVCRDGYTAIAALLLSAPAYRWTPEALQESFLADLRAMAAHLSYRMGAPLYAPYRARARDGLQSTAPLDQEEISMFLRGPWAASLACIRPDGRPHVIPVWQEWDGHDFYVIAWRGSQWADYLRSNPLVSLTIDEPWVPLRRVVVQGGATAIAAGETELQRLLGRMTRRYLGQPVSHRMLEQVEQAFRIQPESVRGYRGLLSAST